MLFLLGRKDFDLLIIDQPEDDLDNQTIYTEVIRRLLDLKGKCRIIFATHSPNIPISPAGWPVSGMAVRPRAR